MKLLVHIISIIFITTGLCGCDRKSSSTELSDTKWQLKGYVTTDNQSIKKTKANNKDAFLLEFMNNIQTYGWGERNSIGGKYRTSGTQISFEELISTQSATKLEDEHIFFNMIENATEYAIENHELYLFSDQKKSYLIFSKL